MKTVRKTFSPSQRMNLEMGMKKRFNLKLTPFLLSLKSIILKPLCALVSLCGSPLIIQALFCQGGSWMFKEVCNQMFRLLILCFNIRKPVLPHN